MSERPSHEAILDEMRRMHQDIINRRASDDWRSWVTGIMATVLALGIVAAVGLLWSNSVTLAGIQADTRNLTSAHNATRAEVRALEDAMEKHLHGHP